MTKNPPHDIEHLAVVTKSDRLKYFHPRGHTLPPKSIFRIVIIFIENSKGEILIHKRAKAKDYGAGLWENAAGGNVGTERYKTAAYRELFEEIGVSKKDLTLRKVAKHIHIDKNDGRGRMMCWFYGNLDWPLEKFALDPREVEKVEWRSKKELYQDVKTHPDNYMPSAIYWEELFP